MLQSAEWTPIQVGQLCYAYCGNLRFYGILDYSLEAGDFVIRNLSSGIEALVSLLDAIHTFTGIDVLSLPNEELTMYLSLKGQKA